jgi:hypothetical protein
MKSPVRKDFNDDRSGGQEPPLRGRTEFALSNLGLYSKRFRLTFHSRSLSEGSQLEKPLEVSVKEAAKTSLCSDINTLLIVKLGDRIFDSDVYQLY